MIQGLRDITCYALLMFLVVAAPVHCSAALPPLHWNPLLRCRPSLLLFPRHVKFGKNGE